MREKGKSFWCEIWGQQIYEEVCIHRHKKGLKKCEGCEKGHQLVAVLVAQLAKKSVKRD